MTQLFDAPVVSDNSVSQPPESFSVPALEDLLTGIRNIIETFKILLKKVFKMKLKHNLHTSP